MSDINATIAKFKGNKGYEIGLSERETLVKRPRDFQGDARLYMELYEEIAKIEGVSVAIVSCQQNMYQVELNDWRGVPRSESVPKISITPTLNDVGTAICYAYIKLHGLECEG